MNDPLQWTGMGFVFHFTVENLIKQPTTPTLFIYYIYKKAANIYI